MKGYTNTFSIGQILNADFQSDPLRLNQDFGYAIQIKWTGTPTGTFKLQASAVQNMPIWAPVPSLIWTDIANSSVAVTAAGDFMWNVSGSQYNWVRLCYTDGSGGTSTAAIADAYITAKGF